MDLNKYGGNDFLRRMEYHIIKKEKKIEKIRSEQIDPEDNELTFKPKINNKLTKKRSIDDLYVEVYNIELES